MKRIILLIIASSTIFLNSCKEEIIVQTSINEHIIAGQTTGNGYVYYDLNPDLLFSIYNPIVNNDTVIPLDINNDGINDFELLKHTTNAGAIGDCGYDYFINPLNSNEICIDSCTYYLDNIPMGERIDSSFDHWTASQAELFWFYRSDFGDTYEFGLWQNVFTKNTHFIGIRLIEGSRTYYGWIGMHRNIQYPGGYIITDWALCKEYVVH